MADYYDAYLAERAQLIKNEFEAYRDFDKWLMTVAGSALALSLTFLKDIVPFKEAHYTGLAVAAWGCLLLSLTASLVSVLSSPIAHARFRKGLDEAGEAGFDEGYWERVRAKQHGDVIATLTAVLNVTALSLFVFGVAFLIAFTAINTMK